MSTVTGRRLEVSSNPIPLQIATNDRTLDIDGVCRSNTTTIHNRIQAHQHTATYDISKLSFTPQQSEEYRKKHFKVTDQERNGLVGSRIASQSQSTGNKNLNTKGIKLTLPMNAPKSPSLFPQNPSSIGWEEHQPSIGQTSQSTQERTNIAARWLRDQKDQKNATKIEFLKRKDDVKMMEIWRRQRMMVPKHYHHLIIL